MRVKISKLLTLAAMFFIGVTTAGCIDHSKTYLTNSQASANLQLPYHTKSNALDNDYPLPKGPQQGEADPSLVPPGLDLSSYHHKH